MSPTTATDPSSSSSSSSSTLSSSTTSSLSLAALWILVAIVSAFLRRTYAFLICRGCSRCSLRCRLLFVAASRTFLVFRFVSFAVRWLLFLAAFLVIPRTLLRGSISLASVALHVLYRRRFLFGMGVLFLFIIRLIFCCRGLCLPVDFLVCLGSFGILFICFVCFVCLGAFGLLLLFGFIVYLLAASLLALFLFAFFVLGFTTFALSFFALAAVFFGLVCLFWLVIRLFRRGGCLRLCIYSDVRRGNRDALLKYQQTLTL